MKYLAVALGLLVFTSQLSESVGAEKEDEQQAYIKGGDECNPNTTYTRYVYDYDGSEYEPCDCYYYECTSAKKFERRRCPDGIGFDDMFKREWNVYGAGQSFNPCTIPNSNCKIRRVPFQITIPICDNDFVFAVDISCSINPKDKEKVRKFLQSVVRRIPIGPRFSQIGIILFSESVYDIAQLDTYTRRRQLLNAIKVMEMGPKKCGRSTWLALEYARQVSFLPMNGAREGKKKVLIVITDGKTSPAVNKTDTMNMARANIWSIWSNIISYVVALPNAEGLIGHDEWNAIAAGNVPDPPGVMDPNVFALNSFDELRNIVNTIVVKTCMAMMPVAECNHNDVKYQYDHDKSDFEQTDCNYYECSSLNRFDRKSCPIGKGVSDVFKLKYNMYGKGQLYDPCKKDVPTCMRSLVDGEITNIQHPTCDLDFVFAVDTSGSINPEDKEKIRESLISVIRRIPVRPLFSQVGIVLFSKYAHTIAHLDSYVRRGQLLNVVQKMDMKPKNCGKTTWLTLKYAREVSFNPKNGAREGKKKVLIVITNGKTSPAINKSDTIKMAQANIKANITSYVVVVPILKAGGLAGHDEWNAIATGNVPDLPGVMDPNVFALHNFDQLRIITSSIVDKACMVM